MSRIFPVPLLADGRWPVVSQAFKPGVHDGLDIMFPAAGGDPTHDVDPLHRSRSTKSGRSWYMPEGVPALAIDGGHVEAVGDIGNGIRVRVRHADASKSYYLHLRKALVTEGDDVSPGDVIGLCGGNPHKGNAGLVHLHFGLSRGYRASKPAWLDPEPLMRSQGWTVLRDDGETAGPFGARAVATATKAEEPHGS